MLYKPLFTIKQSHVAKVDPHRLLYSRFAQMHNERIG